MASECPFEAVAAFLRLVDDELERALQHANTSEAKNVGLPEIMNFELFKLRLRRDAMKAPGVFARSSTRRRHALEMQRLNAEQQEIVEAADAARDALDEVAKFRSDPLGFVQAKIAREAPLLFASVAAWLGDTKVIAEARNLNRTRDPSLSFTRLAHHLEGR